MILRYIKLKNFCPYYGEQTIQFATDKYCNVTVIRGVNGTGKTSLLTALNWCLYGDDFFKEDTREFVNRRVVAEGENVDTSVEIGFVGQEDIAYRVERKRQWYRDNTSLLLQMGSEPPDKDIIASDKIRSIIPEDVSAHFFFDGEKIDNFARQGNEEEIKNAVRNVLRVEIFERAIAHLEKVAKDYQRELKKYVPDDLKELIDKREEKEKSHTQFSSNIRENENKIKIAQKHLYDIEKQLNDFEEARKLFEEQQNISKNKKALNDDLTQSQDRIRHFANDGYIPLAKPVIIKALDILDKQVTQVGIPEEILNNILEQMYCLCGRSLQNDSPEYQHIQDIISQNVSPEIGLVVRETKKDISRMLLADVVDIPDNITRTLKNIHELEKEIEEYETQISDINNKLESFDDINFQECKKLKEEYKKTIKELEDEINQGKGRIKEIKSDIELLDREITKARSLEVKAERLRLCRKLALDSSTEMKKRYDPLEENMRKELEVEVSTIFKKLVWKEESFREVRLSSDYELQVIDRYNGLVSPEISAGEREVLSLAFIAALAKVAVKEKQLDIPEELFPIVMDAPFTKLSDKPKENITETMPSIANQLIMFITDQELRPDESAWRNLEPRIGIEYELNFNDETSTTTIKRID